MNRLVLVAVIVGLVSMGTAQADTIYSTFGSGSTYDAVDGVSANGTYCENAVSFVPNADYVLSSIVVAFTSSYGTQPFQVCLAGNTSAWSSDNPLNGHRFRRIRGPRYARAT
jgi:hypothetical protein